jgi:hypothetical protein
VFQDPDASIGAKQQLEPHSLSAGPAFWESVIQKKGHFMRGTMLRVDDLTRSRVDPRFRPACTSPAPLSKTSPCPDCNEGIIEVGEVRFESELSRPERNSSKSGSSEMYGAARSSLYRT